MRAQDNEQTPLLQRSESFGEQHEEDVQIIEFSKEDPDNPRLWPYSRKMANVAIIALMAVVSPLGSSMFTPGISEIAKCLNTTDDMVVGATTGYVVLLGIGPMILAPLSETFGRRKLYLSCFTVFTLLQIPTAMSPNIQCLIAVRTFAGFFGSVAIANGGGTISDMFVPSERASIFGWYLLGPLIGPTFGPLLGGLIVQYLDWRWVFWILTIVCSVNILFGFAFLKESYAPWILARKCEEASKTYGGRFTFPEQDMRPFSVKLRGSLWRPVRILTTQPIVIIMSLYQAVIFASMYTLFTNMEDIFHNPPYDFDTTQVGLLFLAPGAGFLIAVWFVVPRIDTVYNKFTARNNGIPKPEFRLPLTNIGAVLLPTTLFWFAWTTEFRAHWATCISATVFFGLGQVAIFNGVQNYYIDAFSKYAASAIAAGAVVRSLVGGIVPLISKTLFREWGYGWGWSFYAFLSLALAPSPMLFIKYGERIREKFAIEL